MRQRRYSAAVTHYKEAQGRKGLTRWQRRALSKKLARARRKAR
jgi:hypothetical protein